MVEEQDQNQYSVSHKQVAEHMGFMPQTVVDSTKRESGETLHTLDPDPDTDIEIYDDERDAHLVGENPEAAK